MNANKEPDLNTQSVGYLWNRLNEPLLAGPKPFVDNVPNLQVLDLADSTQICPLLSRPDGHSKNWNGLHHHGSHSGKVLRHCPTAIQKFLNNSKGPSHLHRLLCCHFQHSEGKKDEI